MAEVKLKLMKCNHCEKINPIAELINTITCITCRKGTMVTVENGYVLIDSETFHCIEINKGSE